MKVKRLEINAFRNIKDIELIPSEGANIIYGDNGQGKTNILEAMWLFTGSRSFRGSKEKELIPTGEVFAGVALDFFAHQRDQKGSIRWHEDKRQVFLNEVAKKNITEFSGVFCGVIFSPDHLSLVKAGPENRRIMVDSSLFQAYPKYITAMSNYTKALRQRNALLKDIAFNSSLLEMLELWDKHIIDYGGYISAIRNRYIAKLGEYSSEIYTGISGGNEKLTVDYMPNFTEGLTSDFTLADYKNSIKEALTANRGEDIKQGITTVGPHRDDVDIQLNALSARTYGSQGQQRSSVLSLKLAECRILEEQTGEPPVIMLDDVMSELDKNRRSYLLNKLKDKQVFITCCDTTAFKELDNGKIFGVKAGKIIEEKKVG